MAPQPPRWLRSPWWDTALLAYPWLPFYAFFVFGLGLDGSWDRPLRDELRLATVIALACSYVHRHYTFLLVYGDRPTFEERKRAYSVVPACLFVLLAVVIRNQGDIRLEVPGVRGGLRPWMVVLVVAGA